MSSKNTSETAFAIASLRALSNYESNEEIRTNDNLAEIFIPEDRKNSFLNNDSREMIKKSLPPGLYEYVIARTKYFDAIFIEALANNIDQVVFLGAGFDTRPYRFNHLIKNTKIFEVDEKPTQEHKILLLQTNNISIHRNITFVSNDFETEDFTISLGKNKYDKSKKTLFLLEGVCFYLTHNTVYQMMKLIRENSGAGSRLCFDFQTIQSNNDLIDTGLKNETIKFGIKSGEINNFVINNGFIIVEHITSVNMENKFLKLQDGGFFGKIAPIMNFLLIEHT